MSMKVNEQARNSVLCVVAAAVFFVVSSTPAIAAGLTKKDLMNATAYAEDMEGDGKHALKFKNGKHDNGEGTDEILDVAVGDLDGDGFDDGAIVFYENWGGSGCFMQLSVFLYKDGKPVQIGLRTLEDRSKTNSLTINNRVLTLDVMLHGPMDAAPFPTKKRVVKLTVKGGKLVGPEVVELADQT